MLTSLNESCETSHACALSFTEQQMTASDGSKPNCIRDSHSIVDSFSRSHDSRLQWDISKAIALISGIYRQFVWCREERKFSSRVCVSHIQFNQSWHIHMSRENHLSSFCTNRGICCCHVGHFSISLKIIHKNYYFCQLFGIKNVKPPSSQMVSSRTIEFVRNCGYIWWTNRFSIGEYGFCSFQA